MEERKRNIFVSIVKKGKNFILFEIHFLFIFFFLKNYNWVNFCCNPLIFFNENKLILIDFQRRPFSRSIWLKFTPKRGNLAALMIAAHVLCSTKNFVITSIDAIVILNISSLSLYIYLFLFCLVLSNIKVGIKLNIWLVILGGGVDEK